MKITVQVAVAAAALRPDLDVPLLLVLCSFWDHKLCCADAMTSTLLWMPTNDLFFQGSRAFAIRLC